MTSETILSAFQMARPRGQDLPAKPTTRKPAPVRGTTRVLDASGKWCSKLAPNSSANFVISPAPHMTEAERIAHMALRDARGERGHRNTLHGRKK